MSGLNITEDGELIMSDAERAVLLGIPDPGMAACFGVDRVMTKGTIVTVSYTHLTLPTI